MGAQANCVPQAFAIHDLWLSDTSWSLQAHGGGVLFHNGTYYWFGEHKGGVTYVKYSEG